MEEYVNGRDGQGNTALHWAVYSNQVSSVALLLALGADPHLRDLNGNTALHVAVMANHPKIVKELLSHNSHTNSP